MLKRVNLFLQHLSQQNNQLILQLQRQLTYQLQSLLPIQPTFLLNHPQMLLPIRRPNTSVPGKNPCLKLFAWKAQNLMVLLGNVQTHRQINLVDKTKLAFGTLALPMDLPHPLHLLLHHLLQLLRLLLAVLLPQLSAVQGVIVVVASALKVGNLLNASSVPKQAG